MLVLGAAGGVGLTAVELGKLMGICQRMTQSSGTQSKADENVVFGVPCTIKWRQDTPKCSHVQVGIEFLFSDRLGM